MSECKLCGKTFKNMALHHTKVHAVFTFDCKTHDIFKDGVLYDTMGMDARGALNGVPTWYGEGEMNTSKRTRIYISDDGKYTCLKFCYIAGSWSPIAAGDKNIISANVKVINAPKPKKFQFKKVAK